MSPSRLVQFAVLGGALLGLAACSSGSSTTIAGVPGNPNGVNTNAFCDPGTAVQLANPPSGNVSVPTNLNQVIIVASGNNNTLGSTFSQWNTYLIDNFGNQIAGGPLSAYSWNGGPKPYASDYYYSSSISGLVPGRNYTVYLNQNANCQPGSLGGFST